MKKLLALSILASLAASAGADSLADRKYWKGEMDYVDRSLKAGEEACGVKFSFDWVDREKLKAEAEKNSNSPNGICAAIVDEVVGICRAGDDDKSAVKSKIKGFRCGYAKERTLTLKGGIVTYMGNNQQSNFSDWAKPILEKNL